MSNIYTALEVFNLIERIAATSSKTVKEEILAKIANSHTGAWVLKRTYDPGITYGITPTMPRTSGNAIFDPELVDDLLMALARRELTGNEAKAEVQEMLESLAENGQKLLFRILSKDLRCGINVKSVDKVMPGLLQVFAVARAQPYSAKKAVFPCYGEPKLDGMRVTFKCVDGVGGFFTRTGGALPALDHLIEPIMSAYKVLVGKPSSLWTKLESQLIPYISSGGRANFVLDGEVMTGLFASTGKVRKTDGTQAGAAEFHMFDILSLEDFDAVGEAGPEFQMRADLLGAFSAHTRDSALQVTPIHTLRNDDEVQAKFEEYLNTPLATYLARGNKDREAELMKILIDKETGQPKMLEGLMVKKWDGKYEKKKGYNWMKLKAEETEDLIVVGFFQGEPHTKYENSCGGLIVRRNGVDVRVGGGFKDRQRDELWEDWQHDAAELKIDANCGFSGDWLDPTMMERAFAEHEFALLGRMIEVKFHEVTPDGSLRHPRFIRFRDDKNGEVEDKAAAVAALAARQAEIVLPAGFGRF